MLEFNRKSDEDEDHVMGSPIASALLETSPTCFLPVAGCWRLAVESLYLPVPK